MKPESTNHHRNPKSCSEKKYCIIIDQIMEPQPQILINLLSELKFLSLNSLKPQQHYKVNHTGNTQTFHNNVSAI